MKWSPQMSRPSTTVPCRAAYIVEPALPDRPPVHRGHYPNADALYLSIMYAGVPAILRAFQEIPTTGLASPSGAQVLTSR
jgi:hypothetical protein